MFCSVLSILQQVLKSDDGNSVIAFSYDKNLFEIRSVTRDPLFSSIQPFLILSMRFSSHSLASATFAFLALVSIPRAFAEKIIATLDFTGESKISTFEAPLSETLASSLKSAAPNVTLDPFFSKQGTSSLKWNWKAGDELHFKIASFDSERANGPYASWRPCIQLWLHSDESHTEPLLITHDAAPAGKAATEFPISLEHSGAWQRNIISYYYNLGVPLGTVPQQVILIAPDAGSGTLHIELACFDMQYANGNATWEKPGERKLNNQKAEALYQKLNGAFTPSENNKPTPSELTRVEKIAREVVHSAKPAPKDPLKAATDAAAQLDAFTKSRWLDRNNISTYADAELKQLYFLPGETNLNTAQSQLLRAARLHEELAPHPDSQAILGSAILRFIAYCEFQLGPDFIINSSEITSLRDLLIRNRLFDRYVTRCITQSSDFFTRLTSPEPRMQGNIEALGWGGGEFPGILRATYLLDRNEKIALAHRALEAGINRAICNPSIFGGYLDDGTVNHHGVPNWSYGSYCVPGFYDQLGKTYTRYGFLNQQSLDLMKRVLMRAEASSVGLEVPFVLHARWLGNSKTFPAKSFRDFALHGTIDGSIDPDAARAYLNLVPDDPEAEPLRAAGFKPGPVPAQTFTMPWSCLLVHRGDDYLATIKGFNNWVAAFEMQGSNRLARYLSHGFLQLSNNDAGVDKFTLAESGFSFDGLDWNHLPGTTSKPLPYDQLHRNLGRARGTETFTGGLATTSRHGIFAMKLRDIVDKTFTARKSYFCFGPHIICLGSDIHADDPKYPIHTTLFQKHLSTSAEVVQLNGKEITGFPYESTTPGSSSTHWLIDPQGIGYVVPEGQPITLRRSHQISYAASSGDQTLGPSNEADQTVCWIDHGKAPSAAGYEYAILINRPAAEIESYARNLGSEDKKPYQVLQKNTDAHILRDSTFEQHRLRDLRAKPPARQRRHHPLHQQSLPRHAERQREKDHAHPLRSCPPPKSERVIDRLRSRRHHHHPPRRMEGRKSSIPHHPKIRRGKHRNSLLRHRCHFVRHRADFTMTS